MLSPLYIDNMILKIFHFLAPQPGHFKNRIQSRGSAYHTGRGKWHFISDFSVSVAVQPRPNALVRRPVISCWLWINAGFWLLRYFIWGISRQESVHYATTLIHWLALYICVFHTHTLFSIWWAEIFRHHFAAECVWYFSICSPASSTRPASARMPHYRERRILEFSVPSLAFTVQYDSSRRSTLLAIAYCWYWLLIDELFVYFWRVLTFTSFPASRILAAYKCTKMVLLVTFIVVRAMSPFRQYALPYHRRAGLFIFHMHLFSLYWFCLNYYTLFIALSLGRAIMDVTFSRRLVTIAFSPFTSVTISFYYSMQRADVDRYR